MMGNVPVLVQVAATLRALKAVSATMRNKYGAVFTYLQPQLASIVDRLGTIQDGTISSSIAVFLVVRNTVKGPRTFQVHLLRGEDRVWRIAGM
jgi:hypothetical protein